MPGRRGICFVFLELGFDHAKVFPGFNFSGAGRFERFFYSKS